MCHLAHSSGVVVPINPQTSAPTIGMPNILDYITPSTEYPIYSTFEKLSPSHLDANLPEPAKELLLMINGRLC